MWQDCWARYRLVTVTGPGGVGKTRLAGEVTRRVADRFADGAWPVDLTAVSEPALLPAAVATALGLQQPPGMSVMEALGAALSRQMLLVLDNCEHVLDAAAQLCAAMLPSADDIRILATSREPLGLAEASGTTDRTSPPGPRSRCRPGSLCQPAARAAPQRECAARP